MDGCYSDSYSSHLTEATPVKVTSYQMQCLLLVIIFLYLLGTIWVSWSFPPSQSLLLT